MIVSVMELMTADQLLRDIQAKSVKGAGPIKACSKFYATHVI